MLSYDSTMVSVRDGLIKASVEFFSCVVFSDFHTC